MGKNDQMLKMFATRVSLSFGLIEILHFFPCLWRVNDLIVIP